MIVIWFFEVVIDVDRILIFLLVSVCVIFDSSWCWLSVLIWIVIRNIDDGDGVYSILMMCLVCCCSDVVLV